MTLAAPPDQVRFMYRLMIVTRTIVAVWILCGIIALVRAQGPIGVFGLLLVPLVWLVSASATNVKKTIARFEERGLSTAVAHARGYWVAAMGTAAMYGAVGAVLCIVAATRITPGGLYINIPFAATVVGGGLAFVWAVLFTGFFRQRR